MKKVFLSTLIALTVGIQNLCGAVEISREQSNFHDKIFYPQVRMQDSIIECKINTQILAEIDRFVTDVYRNAQQNSFEIADIRADYQIGSNESGGTIILSIVFTESNYFTGAAHPATYETALNFNIATGELMDVTYLTDVGEGIDEADLINTLDEKLREHCQRENLYLFSEALPLKNLPKNFYWDENLHVHFIFQHYEVAPYAAGIIDVDIEN